VYKTANHIVDTLVDVVSKNGNLLMNVTQKPDGSIDDEARFTLKKVGEWLRANGDGIYETRPYRKYREGKTELVSGSFQEDPAEWKSTDYRFTTRGNAVYAFMMRPGASGKAFICTLGRMYAPEIKSVQMYGRPVSFVQKDGALQVDLPDGLNRAMPVCIRAEF